MAVCKSSVFEAVGNGFALRVALQPSEAPSGLGSGGAAPSLQEWRTFNDLKMGPVGPLCNPCRAA